MRSPQLDAPTPRLRRTIAMFVVAASFLIIGVAVALDHSIGAGSGLLMAYAVKEGLGALL
jgi:hypothetical protein